MPHCSHDLLENKVLILVSKKRCAINSHSILIKKGVSKKNAVLKIRGFVVPNKINTRIYQGLFVDKKSVNHIPFYKEE